MLPPFAALRAFEAVFRTGGIRKAAISLGLSHAVISRHLKSLEDWLGEPLLVRSGNRVSLNEKGAVYHARISAALNDMQIATDELLHRQKHGQLRLCCVPGLSIQWLSAQLAEFERRHPEYPIELKPTDQTPNLLVHEADADIRYMRDVTPTSSSPRGLRACELARPEIMAVATPDIAARLNRATSAEALLNEVLLHEENQVEWRGWLEQNRVAMPDILPGPLCWHAHLAIAAARLGRGIALASDFLVTEDLARGDLVEVKPAGSHRVALGYYALIAREDRWSRPALACLRQFLWMNAQRGSAADRVETHSRYREAGQAKHEKKLHVD